MLSAGMTQYRRLRQNGGTYFFTVALHERGTACLTDHIGELRQAVLTTKRERPFRIDTMVVLPDHLHAIWTLSQEDDDFSTRWRLIKSRFSREVGFHRPRSPSQIRKQERGLWQRRFWVHLVRDGEDYARLTTYCWNNPVKHGLVARPQDWPFSSIHRDRM
jgi:putative transposase